jgi:hypothetical protein
MNTLSEYLFSFVNTHLLDAKDFFNSVFLRQLLAPSQAHWGARAVQKIAESPSEKFVNSDKAF